MELKCNMIVSQRRKREEAGESYGGGEGGGVVVVVEMVGVVKVNKVTEVGKVLEVADGEQFTESSSSQGQHTRELKPNATLAHGFLAISENCENSTQKRLGQSQFTRWQRARREIMSILTY